MPKKPLQQKSPNGTSKGINKELRLTPYYNKSDYYTFCLSPDDTHQYFMNEQRDSRFRSLVYEFCFSLKNAHIDYVQWFELSEPCYEVTGRGPRLHTHGVIKFRSSHSIYTFLLKVLPQALKYGRVEIHKITDLPTWIKYCLKQQFIMAKTMPPIYDNEVFYTKLLELST